MDYNVVIKQCDTYNVTDINNHTYSDVTLYIDPFYKGYNANVDRLVGKKIEIIYNPLTGEVAKSNTILRGAFLMLE